MKRYIIYILSLWFAVACTKFDEEALPTTATLGDSVAVAFGIGVGSITGDTEELPSITTRTEETTEPDDATVSLIDGISSAVMNLWVVQFDGTSDESKVVSMSYIDKDMDLVGTTLTVNLVATSEATTILFLANTFNDQFIPSLGYTIAEVKALNYPVATNLEDVDDPNSNQLSYAKGLVVEDGSEKYFTMSCAIDYQISGTGTDTGTATDTDTAIDTDTDTADLLDIKLLRNAVKLTFVLNNNWEGAEITSISIKDAAEMSYYYSSYLSDRSIDESNEDPFPLNTSPVDYQTTTLSIAEEESQTITLYVPANLKGVNPKSTVESKSYYAPATSTYVYIEALQNGSQTYTYTYYLGANLIDNYNLRPNWAYTYTLGFKEGGSADTDYSVEASEVDYTLREASNCYILNPSASEDVVYYIPIKSRINTFWNSYATKNTSSERLTTQTNWDYAVLWYDNDNSPICTAVWDDDVDVSTPTTDQVKIERVAEHSDGIPALKVTLPKGFDNDGNMVVAVYDRDANITDGTSITQNTYGKVPIVDGDILWSWHFWITDYNPDSRQHSPVAKSYNYSVAGGEIHRYKDNEYPTSWDDYTPEQLTSAVSSAKANHTYFTSLWDNEGVYANSFILDRNLGARGTSELEQGAGVSGTTETSRYYHPGALYYQNGRKDPFIANHGNFINGKDTEGNYTYDYIAFDTDYSNTTYRRREARSVSGGQCNVSFEESVLRPTVYFYSTDNNAENNWTNEANANTTEYLWNDHYVSNNTDTYYTIDAKSIFDPSPLGWRMPLRGTWDNFNSDVNSTNPNDTYSTTNIYESRIYNVLDEDGKTTLGPNTIYPGASGIMVGGNFFKSQYYETLSWSATPYDRSAESTYKTALYSSYLGAYSGGVYPQGASWHYRQIGMPVRPVKCQ